MRTSGLLLLIFLLALAALPAAAQDSRLVLEGGTVFDGTGAVLPNAVVTVRGGTIEQVGPAGQVAIPAGARRFDARGKFILPGFVDLHFHYSPTESPWLPLFFLAQGVTTIREMGGWIEHNQKWLADTRARGLPVPRLLYTGPLLDAPPSAYPKESFVLLDEMDARRVANELMDKGATSLKVYFRLPPTFIRAIIEEADKRNVPVHGHLEIVDPRDAIALGLDGLEHTTSVGRALLPPNESEAFRQDVIASNAARSDGRYRAWSRIDPAGEQATALIELMRRNNVNLTATLAVFEPAREEAENHRWQASRNMAAFTVGYHRAGGPVSIGSHGTVANAEPGFAFQREVEMHVEGGMSPSDALQAATRVGAAALRLNDRGLIAPGRLADFVILDADPLADIKNLTRVDAVILDGQVLDRRALLTARPPRTGAREPMD